LPARVDGPFGEHRLELIEHLARFEIGLTARVARNPVAQLVIVRDLGLRRRDARNVIGERPVKAHV